MSDTSGHLDRLARRVAKVLEGAGLEKYRTPSGGYDGVRMLADLSGLGVDEVRWTAMRMKQLIAEGKTTAAAKRMIAEEARGKPWARERSDGDGPTA